jgi:hypothetical protein
LPAVSDNLKRKNAIEEENMSPIMPQSELLRRAVQYVNDTRTDNPEKSLAAVIDDAAMRFNLSPLDGEALYRLFSSSGDLASSADTE